MHKNFQTLFLVSISGIAFINFYLFNENEKPILKPQRFDSGFFVQVSIPRDIRFQSEANRNLSDPIVDSMLKKIVDDGMVDYLIPGYFRSISMAKMARMLGARARHDAARLKKYLWEKTEPKNGTEFPSWQRVHWNIKRFSYYDPDDPEVARLLHDIATLPVVGAEAQHGGTQFKLALEFSDGGKAIVKFMRTAREVDEDENRYVYDIMERHVAEIASFQLDKVLGFYRIPPTIGRKFNITSELLPYVDKDVKNTFYMSPAGNMCFFGTCEPKHYCNTAHPLCGSPDVIEASVMSFFPNSKYAHRSSWEQPWKRTYRRNRKAYWELHDDLCISVRKTPPFNNGKLLLDIIDVLTFDFLTGNKDRHNIAMFREWTNYTFPLIYDNGRGFAWQGYDAMSILAPLNQCCIIRHSTFLKYLKVYLGPETLSSLMERALADDPVAPVLLPGHLRALDRRLVKILQAVAKCIEKNGVRQVIVKDQF